MVDNTYWWTIIDFERQYKSVNLHARLFDNRGYSYSELIALSSGARIKFLSGSWTEI